ncbi:unnamed protein product [Rotaria magnacalcarata]
MFFSAYLWRLLRRRSSRIDSPTTKINCRTCLNLTLATMSHKNNNHTTLPQFSDLAILSTSTLQNMITHPVETTSAVTIATTTTSEITTIITTTNVISKLHSAEQYEHSINHLANQYDIVLSNMTWC